ncbi:MAG: hypothetical protein WBY88_07890, partial [Desulfosarcina sp.]
RRNPPLSLHHACHLFKNLLITVKYELLKTDENKSNESAFIHLDITRLNIPHCREFSKLSQVLLKDRAANISPLAQSFPKP